MANSDKLNTAMNMIPFHALQALGRIFQEGLRYGRNNWKDGADADFVEERLNHAIRHLMLWANGDRDEDHLAKVMWFCVTTLELQRTVPGLYNELLKRATKLPSDTEQSVMEAFNDERVDREYPPCTDNPEPKFVPLGKHEESPEHFGTNKTIWNDELQRRALEAEQAALMQTIAILRDTYDSEDERKKFEDQHLGKFERPTAEQEQEEINRQKIVQLKKDLLHTLNCNCGGCESWRPELIKELMELGIKVMILHD